jgi:hypothetical protein
MKRIMAEGYRGRKLIEIDHNSADFRTDEQISQHRDTGQIIPPGFVLGGYLVSRRRITSIPYIEWDT